jgi:hypothetical protein
LKKRNGKTMRRKIKSNFLKGDPIGRIFAKWSIVYVLWEVFKIIEVAQIHGPHFGRIFSQTYLVTLTASQIWSSGDTQVPAQLGEA